MNLNKADGLIYSRSENISQSENSSASISTSDPDDVLVEEQEPSSSVASSDTSNDYTLDSRVLQSIRENNPWAKRRYSPTLESLHDEVMDLFIWLRPTAEEIALRRSIFRRVEIKLGSLYPYAQVKIFGSVATNLFLPSSDIDVSVRLRNYTLEDLSMVADTFRKLSDVFDNVQLVDRTDVPIVKLRHKDTKFSIDISFNKHSNVLKNVEYVNEQKNSIPELEPLILVLKQYLAQRGLNRPFSGGLSSYGLILMVIVFIKVYSKEAWRGTTLEKVPLGLLLFEFFYFYGHQFKYEEDGIRVREPCIVKKEFLAVPANQDKCSSMFFIEDPLQRGNNVGKSAYNMLAIKLAFAESYDFLRNALIHCQFTNYLRYYWGPMLSLVVSLQSEEISFRQLQKDAVLNNDVLLKRRRDHMNLLSNNFTISSANDKTNKACKTIVLQQKMQYFVPSSVPPMTVTYEIPVINERVSAVNTISTIPTTLRMTEACPTTSFATNHPRNYNYQQRGMKKTRYGGPSDNFRQVCKSISPRIWEVRGELSNGAAGSHDQGGRHSLPLINTVPVFFLPSSTIAHQSPSFR